MPDAGSTLAIPTFSMPGSLDSFPVLFGLPECRHKLPHVFRNPRIMFGFSNNQLKSLAAFGNVVCWSVEQTFGGGRDVKTGAKSCRWRRRHPSTFLVASGQMPEIRPDPPVVFCDRLCDRIGLAQLTNKRRSVVPAKGFPLADLGRIVRNLLDGCSET